MNQTIFILCGDHRQFNAWCHENNWNPKDERVRYLSRPSNLHGIMNPIIFRWGTWYARPSYELDEIEAIAKALTKKDYITTKTDITL